MEWYRKQSVNPILKKFGHDMESSMGTTQWCAQYQVHKDSNGVYHLYKYQHCELEGFPTIGWQAIEYEEYGSDWVSDHGEEFAEMYEPNYYTRHMIGIRNSYLINDERYYDITIRVSIMCKRKDNDEFEEFWIMDDQCEWYDEVSFHRLKNKGIQLNGYKYRVVDDNSL